MPFALTTAESIDLAIAGATFLLALGTFWMAWGTRVLAKTTQRQHDEARTPVLRVARISPPGDVDICVVNEGHRGEAFVVSVENCGPVAAEVVSSAVSGLGEGKASDELTVDPIISPNEVRDFDFKVDGAVKERLRSGEAMEITITYLASATGRHYRVAERVRCKLEAARTERGISHGPRERWLLETAGTPTAF